MTSSAVDNDPSLTAQDYIQSQLDLEREARDIMPYDPNECTYNKGELRQPVFACLTCSKANDNTPIGVCYSCSIQCHSTHDIVELFSKRGFVCDCGTTKMNKIAGGACKLRIRDNTSSSSTNGFIPTTGFHSRSNSFSRTSSSIQHDAEDISSSSNLYNQNFHGLFCSCEQPYNPLEETGNMIQCYFGFNCGEDWYHEDCILGYQKGLFKDKPELEKSGENLLDKLPPPGEDAESEIKVKAEIKPEPALAKKEAPGSDSEDHVDKVPHFPDLDSFDSFICWKCIADFKEIFQQIENDREIVFTKLPHFENIDSVQTWNEKYEQFKQSDEPRVKRVKLENTQTTTPYSIFLRYNFRDKLLKLSKESTSNLGTFLNNHEYLYKDDPVFEPPEDEDGETSTTNSLLDLGTDALSSLPREQAIEGLQAYDKIRSKLKDFFKPFAEQGKVVTEKEVRDFFGAIKKDK